MNYFYYFFENFHIFWVLWGIIFILFFIYIIFLVNKRKHYHSQPTEYAPPQNINPLLAGYLVDGQFHVRDYIAGFIYLVQQEVIDVDKQKPKKITFEGRELSRAQVYIEKIAFTEGYVEKGLSFWKASFLYGSLFFLISLGFILYIFLMSSGIQNIISSFFSSFFLGSIFCALYLSYKIAGLSKMKLTEKGRKAKNSLLGFKKYLQVAESERLKYFNKPKAKPNNFMEYLPYAIALGVDEHWNFKYAGLLKDMPSWYSPKYIRLPVLPEGMTSIIDLIDKVQEQRNVK